MSAGETVDTAISVYDAVVDETESLEEENIGANLAYLLGALLKGTRFEAHVLIHGPFLFMLKNGLGPHHKVWDSIDLADDEGVLPGRIKRSLLAGGLGNLDEEDYPSAGPWNDALNGEE